MSETILPVPLMAGVLTAGLSLAVPLPREGIVPILTKAATVIAFVVVGALLVRSAKNDADPE